MTVSSIENCNRIFKKDAIIPDTMAHNFPMGPNGAGMLKYEAIFDMNKLRVENTSARHFKDGERMKRRAVGTKCHVVKRDCM